MTVAGPRPAAGLSPTIGWALVFFVWFALHATITLMSRTWPEHATNLLLLGAGELVVLGGTAVALALGARAAASPSETLAIDRISVPAIMLGFGLGVFVHPVADAVRNIVEVTSATPEQQLQQKLAILQHDDLLKTLVLFCVVGVAGPLLEELFYRGALYTRIFWRAGARWANFVAAAGFVFAHGDVRDWPSLLMVAAVLTWLRLRTGSVWASVACHLAFNCSTLTWVVLGEEGAPGGWYTVALAAVVATGLLVALAHTTRSLR